MAILNEIELRSNCSSILKEKVYATGILPVNVDFARGYGLPEMIVALTSDTIYLLDWKGNERCRNGPTKIIFAFNKTGTSINSEKQGSTTTLVLSEDGASGEIKARLGFSKLNKSMNKKLIKELEKDGLKNKKLKGEMI